VNKLLEGVFILFFSILSTVVLVMLSQYNTTSKIDVILNLLIFLMTFNFIFFYYKREQ